MRRPINIIALLSSLGVIGVPMLVVADTGATPPSTTETSSPTTTSTPEPAPETTELVSATTVAVDTTAPPSTVADTEGDGTEESENDVEEGTVSTVPPGSTAPVSPPPAPTEPEPTDSSVPESSVPTQTTPTTTPTTTVPSTTTVPATTVPPVTTTTATTTTTTPDIVVLEPDETAERTTKPKPTPAVPAAVPAPSPSQRQPASINPQPALMNVVRGTPAIEAVMTTIRQLESGGNYQAQARGSSASGAYQIIDSTWNNYGGYRRAIDAPAHIQDEYVRNKIAAILEQHDGDYSAIPIIWYYPRALNNSAIMDQVPIPGAGNVLTPREYQRKWLNIFNNQLAEGVYQYGSNYNSQRDGLTAVTWDGVYLPNVALLTATETYAALLGGHSADYIETKPVETIILDESGGLRTVVVNEPTGREGKYLLTITEWDDYQNYDTPSLAPETVQDEWAYSNRVVPAAKTVTTNAGLGAELGFEPDVWTGEYDTQRIVSRAPVLPTQDTDPLIPAIVYPVVGESEFWNGWHDPRDGGARKHVGTDIMGSEGQPLAAAFDGTVTRIQYAPSGTAGVSVTIERADGLRANYLHLNNNTPGSGDDAADPAYRVHPDLFVGAKIRAGQILGYMGDTGNATGVPHLHFEMRYADGTPINPYPALLEALQRQQGAVQFGGWSTDYPSETVSDGLRPADSAALQALIDEAANIETDVEEGQPVALTSEQINQIWDDTEYQTVADNYLWFMTESEQQTTLDVLGKTVVESFPKVATENFLVGDETDGYRVFEDGTVWATLKAAMLDTNLNEVIAPETNTIIWLPFRN